MSALADLGTEKYVLLTTFRKDGRGVPTPIWTVPFDGGIAVWTVAGSGKLKRIRRSGRVTVAPCTLRGQQTGEAVDGEAVITDGATTERVRKALIRKYGLTGWFTVRGSVLRRGRDGTVAVLITAPNGTEPVS